MDAFSQGTIICKRGEGYSRRLFFGGDEYFSNMPMNHGAALYERYMPMIRNYGGLNRGRNLSESEKVGMSCA